jgi:hypothetical protein
MYHGTRPHIQTFKHDKYLPGIGTISVLSYTERIMRHYYTCDHCGKAYSFEGSAVEEDFYCKSELCQQLSKLVSVKNTEG